MRTTRLLAGGSISPHLGKISFPQPAACKLENAPGPVAAEVVLDGSGHCAGVGPLAAHPGHLLQKLLIQHKIRAFHTHNSTRRQRSVLFARWWPLLGALFLIGCGIPGLLHEAREVSNPAMTGEITIRSDDGVLVIWHPDRCRSGEHEQFFGFDLDTAGSELHVRAVLDPLAGAGVRLDGLEREPVILRKRDCARLDLDIRPSGWTINDFRDFSGRIELDCTAVGRRIEGAIDVTHCH
jgi:hypothetical protein